MAHTDLAKAFRIVLQGVAKWRHEALGDHEEYETRDRFLLKLETLARAQTLGRGSVSS